VAAVVQDLNHHPAYLLAQKLTGIPVNFISPPIGQEDDQFNIMVASGNLPDIIVDGRYPGGINAGVEDGLYLDLTDLLSQGKAPNYSAYRNSDELRRKNTLSDSRRVLAFFGLTPYSEWMWFGILIKQEALDKTGLPVPETIDEWYTFLKKCKEAGYNEPLNYGSNYGQIFTDGINGAFGVYDWVFTDKNGKPAWGPVQPGAKEYLALMRKWQEEGLFNADWITADFNQRMAEAVSSNCAVMFDSPDTMWSFWKVQNSLDYVGALNPVLRKGEKSSTTYSNQKRSGTDAAITTQCKDADAAMAWLDFGYTKKGWEILNYGEYGVTHLIDTEGFPYFPENSPIYTDKSYPTTDRLWSDRIHVGPNIRDEHFSNPLIVQKGSYSGDIRKFWTEGMDVSVARPMISFTPQEQSEEASLGTQLSTLRGEYFSKIIMGRLPLEAYDEFAAKANQMGLDRFLALYQAAYNRYNAR
jgi:ABC-type glycerol-3-phosphate transport system substrate-binding protein